MNWLAAVSAWCWWLIALLQVAGGQQYRLVVEQSDTATAHGELADYRQEVAERDRRATVQVRQQEQRRQTVADEVGERARQKLAQGRAADAESSAIGLHREIYRLRAGRSATCSAIAIQQRQAGASTVVVLGRLLEESDRMAGSCAAALERSRIAGPACAEVIQKMKAP